MGFWTPNRLEILREAATEGLSASQIAARIGDGCTRNAVIGKIKRSGLRLANLPSNFYTPKPKERSDQFRVKRRKTNGAHVEPAPIEIEIACEAIDVFSLTRKSCRWPVSGEGYQTLFCGRRKAHGAYCQVHARMAYRPNSMAARSSPQH